MKINHNIQALNAYRNLYSNQAATSKNLEKLSSGLRINRAADDAAGLAISEKMRSQIRGLKQAERNSMDGISLMQTAEGAMTEVHSMLQRMRELSVQAANETNTNTDRDAIQKEIDQLLVEIDSIAAKTEFNTRKLLDGSSAVDTQFSNNNPANITKVPTVIDPSLVTGDYQVTVGGTIKEVKAITQPGAGVNSADVIASSLSDLQGEKLKLGEYSIVVTNVDTTGAKPSATIEVFDPDGFSLGKKASEIGTGATGSPITIGTDDQEIKIDTTLITQAGTAKVRLEYEAEISVKKKNNAATPVYEDITFKKKITTENGLIKHGGLELQFGSNMKTGDSQFTVTNKALSFQIGANSNQGVNIDIPQLSTVKLGIDGIRVNTYEAASDAIFRLDNAITQISAVRSKLGATQNRLEHTINNLQTTSENLTASESRIRDADMALEMTEFTKNNILNQSAQAMLAQANQLPQGILQLLQR
ncbi:flagellin N-terminal helical domain-containing protein [Schinkia azotoformans]|uniref:Flagellin n=1 Tax=Schinkia azotoformans LMG 9581 TaxID=1131731 RepID=K6E367_SCHAZ|nr:flagellin [Schinkia azotoformans]EKN67656.1 flagellin [Schinkia azotoformans LMG 9581]MEC1637572.1 flagellin [Schinkia azotoformans]MEC1696351.1 flagellin [Schinkia azotoformans]MEC1715521.1 flagellin [Schinkia azotoformans]MEC1718852.1 flagellin [Schinkia azotoformans]